MIAKTILTPKQVNFLKLFAEEKTLLDNFYLSGGTALAAFYIPYRYSEDLDFFSKRVFDVSGIFSFLKKIKKSLGYKSLDISTSFNRNLIFLNFVSEQLKVEFVYFPFTQVKTPRKKMGVRVDSVDDIAVNKLFTIYQKPRSRDFMDLFMINRKFNYPIDILIKMAKKKFDWHVDLLALGSQFLLCRDLKDYPKLVGEVKEVKEEKWQKYFIDEARKLRARIVE